MFTSEPLGVMLDGAESGTVPEASVDHRVDGKEVRHRRCKQTPLLHTQAHTHTFANTHAHTDIVTRTQRSLIKT